MSFFSEKDYRDKARGVGEMQLKETAPLLSRPNSPERKVPKRLADIPEATPGPNAFALEAARLDKYRLDTNAFYQEEVQKRKVTPPTALHPALRPRSHSDPPTPPRLSDCTTMSSFVNADKGIQHSPSLKLQPDWSQAAEPTERAFIEGLNERAGHSRSNSKDGRIPVFIPTPKMNSNAFEKPARSGHAVTEHQHVTTSLTPTKTPKKSLLEKLRVTTNFLGISSPAALPHEKIQEVGVDEKMPVKARAVFGPSPTKSRPRTSLGSSPSKMTLQKSPSKRKGLFSRKASDMPSINASKAAATRQSAEIERPPLTGSTIMTPPTAFSDPTHYSYQGKRLASQTPFDAATYKDKDANKGTVVRSQSLKYFDHAIPPTPPAKNTPPDEKARREAAMNALKIQSSRVPFHDDQTTPSKSPTGIVSTNERVSPTKFGGYGHREVATLVTRPSTYSLHASVVPNMTEASAFEEMKARIDDLGLEGFSMPPENNRSPNLAQGYTPSIYSTQFSPPRPSSAFAKLSPATPQAQFHGHNLSTHTKSSSSNVEISICYPGLAGDPSISNMTPSNGPKGYDKPKMEKRSGHLDPAVPFYGYTHSHDHSQSPRQSVDSLIFAHHVDINLEEPCYDSPTYFKHASATPSPLHFLPPTTYIAPQPPRRSSKRPLRPTQSTEPTNNKIASNADTLSNATPAHGTSASPSRRNGLFENAPTLPAQSSRANSRNASPQNSLNGMSVNNDVNIDPLKTSPARPLSGDKLDRMMEMLSQLRARNGEIGSMREEMRASNARLDERLSAVEGSQRASPMPPSDEDVTEWGMRVRDGQQRVATNVAHDFYRLSQVQPECEEEGEAPADAEAGSSKTVAKLMETNKRLLEMCGGFADKIKALEERVNRNS